MNSIVRIKYTKPGVFLLAVILFFLIYPKNILSAMVTDPLGRKVDLPDDPVRVISFAPSITEIMYALGLEDRLVAATRFSDYPEGARSLPRVGTYIQLDIEKIVAFSPDLCLAIKDGNPVGVINRLKDFSIPVYGVDPRDLDSVMETLQQLAGIFHVEEKANAIVHEMEKRIRRVRDLAEATEKKPGVFFQIGISPIVSVGKGTYLDEMIMLSGGRNLASGNNPYPRFTKEQVIALSPDVFIISSMAREAVFAQIQNEWKKWTSIAAVKNNRIHLVDSNLFDRPGPRLVAGLEILFTLIHPELAHHIPAR